MNKLKEATQSVRVFFDDVVAEMKKTSWPDRQELVSSTIVIIVTTLVVSLLVGVIDKVLHAIMRLMFAGG